MGYSAHDNAGNDSAGDVAGVVDAHMDPASSDDRAERVPERRLPSPAEHCSSNHGS